MGVKRPGRSGHTTPAKDAASALTYPRKQTVSTAVLFKNPTLPIRKRADASPKPTKTPRPAARSLSVHKHRSSPRSSSHSPQKVAYGKKSDMHPLAVAFKDTTTAYRTHLYTATAAKLDATLNTLLSQLHARTLATISSPPTDPTASPLKLTLGAKYDRATEKAFRPIGGYAFVVHNTNTNANAASGENGKEKEKKTLRETLMDFDEKYGKEMEEIRGLEAQWEKVVGEIYKTGVACLGDEAMSFVLVPPSPTADSSPLFVPEQDSLPHAPKKRVTFQEPDQQREYPNFLSGPSIYRNHPVAALPGLPEDEVRELEDAVGTLGVEQMEEFKRIEAEQSKWWKKKCEQIAQTLRAE
ncbi:hypothetical protein K458DRAFT_425906 [Lentithecium fluviatile CBS 122367]|uniref:Uncharacterized protein n=1 Tax=Lentithecium fluviatile CBS 122367 TaxID=1168545 RepID=A0A6G1JPQ1_9PLEO|nr:hypothetical protein K458DRAFT_425906 [Lentithecium fluviatile CBS 122367]